MQRLFPDTVRATALPLVAPMSNARKVWSAIVLLWYYFLFLYKYTLVLDISSWHFDIIFTQSDMNITPDRSNVLCYPGSGYGDEKWGMAVTTAGRQCIPPGAGYPLSSHPSGYLFSAKRGRRLDEYQIVYIVEGKGYFASESCPGLPVDAGSALMLFPGEWHTYCPDPETGWTEYWAGFRGESVDAMVRNRFFTKENPVHNVGISTGLISLYEEIISVISLEKAGCMQLVAGIISHILGSIYYKDRNHSYKGTAILDKINEAKQLMKDMQCQLETEQIAVSVGLGYSKFRKVFKEYTGTSPAQYRLQQKLIKAKELLTASDMNISEIAYFLKFDSPGHFSIFFKNMEGITPSEFRGKSRWLYRGE